MTGAGVWENGVFQAARPGDLQEFRTSEMLSGGCRGFLFFFSQAQIDRCIWNYQTSYQPRAAAALCSCGQLHCAVGLSAAPQIA